MSPSFVVYIGNPATKAFFNNDGSGSSRWFVLSAAVIRKVSDFIDGVVSQGCARGIGKAAENAATPGQELRSRFSVPQLQYLVPGEAARARHDLCT